jgi:CarboxypepD_reg-like domain/TonB-dependent Receptor Plug Domain
MQFNKLLLFLLPLLPIAVWGQSSTIRGIVMDQQAETPLIGASVRLVQATDSQPIGAVTDADGVFVLRNVPTGRQALKVTYVGYEPLTIPNILVTAGKDVQLTLKVQESLTQMDEVVITAKVEKDRPVNEMAPISTRQFNVEEAQRYSGGRQDVARMAANFAGVATGNDSRNDIVIRGNSPTGVLWRLEGIPIPNPNHFSTLGTTGGPVSALNTNMIANSDFMTGAFAAEYGNALAGVFDVNLRTGNRERFEVTAQLGAFSGLEAMVEGPLNRKNNGSFVLAYRHSFVELANRAGLDIGATPRYKDLTFNLDFGNTKAGKFSVFGIGGLSAIDFLAKEATAGTNLFVDPTRDSYNTSQFGVVGLKHNLLLGEKSYLRTVVSASRNGATFDEDDLDTNTDLSPYRIVEVEDVANTYRASTTYNYKINPRITLRSGVLWQSQSLTTKVATRNNTPDLDQDGQPDWVFLRDFEGTFNQTEAYVQSQYRIGERLTLNAGLHGLYFDKTDDFAIEPRAALNWALAPKHKMTLGYGLHHQTQPLPVFLYRQRDSEGNYRAANQNLGFTRSQHFVLAYDFKPASDWRIKAETYYQHLTQVPVDGFRSTFSILNSGASFVFPERANLVNEGSGRNYGAEITIEKFFSRGWYILVTTSLFRSLYTGSDEVERSSAFDGRYVFNALAGRELALGNSGRFALTFDTKFTVASGRPYTPIDLAASIAADDEVLAENQAFSLRLDDYMRWDVKFGFRMNSNKRKFSQTFYLDFQNVTNRDNIFAMQYNRNSKTVGRANQIGFFPDMLWRVEF